MCFFYDCACIFSWALFVGDNILTAVSVARECSIIGNKQRVIQVQASPPTDSTSAKIEWLSHDLPGGVEDESTDVDGDADMVSLVCDWLILPALHSLELDCNNDIPLDIGI